MDSARIFKSGRSQAVRLPKRYRFRTSKVMIKKVDDMVIIFSRRKGWDVLAQGLQRFTDDFLAGRNQPARTEERENL